MITRRCLGFTVEVLVSDPVKEEEEDCMGGIYGGGGVKWVQAHCNASLALGHTFSFAEKGSSGIYGNEYPSGLRWATCPLLAELI